MAKQDEINAAIRAAGVVWVACQSCGRDWPFPTGFSNRDWRCTVCANAILAHGLRAIDRISHLIDTTLDDEQDEAAS